MVKQPTHIQIITNEIIQTLINAKLPITSYSSTPNDSIIELNCKNQQNDLRIYIHPDLTYTITYKEGPYHKRNTTKTTHNGELHNPKEPETLITTITQHWNQLKLQNPEHTITTTQHPT